MKNFDIVADLNPCLLLSEGTALSTVLQPLPGMNLDLRDVITTMLILIITIVGDRPFWKVWTTSFGQFFSAHLPLFFLPKKAENFLKASQDLFHQPAKKAKEGRWRRKKGRKVDEEMAKLR